MKRLIISLMFVVALTMSTSIKGDTMFFKKTTNTSDVTCVHSGWFQAGCSTHNTRCRIGIMTYYCWSQNGTSWCCEYECGCNH